MHCVFVCNPAAGGSGAAAKRAKLTREARRTLAADQWRISERPGHAGELAAEAVRAGATRVIAVGGDGTVNEVAGALLASSAALGVVPLGSGNGLARHLGIPLDPLAAFRVAGSERSPAGTIDSGFVDGRPFFNVAGLGLEAEISVRFAAGRNRGLPGYLRLGLRAYAERKSREYRISSSGRNWSIAAVSLAIANSAQYGNGFQVAPEARIDDGLLNLVALPDLGPLNGLRLLGRMLRGAGGPWGGIVRLTGTEFLIDRESEGPIHVDGEAYRAPARVIVRAAPGALKVVLPRQTGPGEAGNLWNRIFR